ncbi:MAG: helix-turn-helix transcriptional regulator [Acidimicrobiales bacterium]|nr:helix-turn-helix transcriptional regulator [Acidimicrobiales bacterium]
MARPRTISTEAILEAGLALGLADLSVSAVAERLGVTRTAIYRHVPGRAALETLVGEHLLGLAQPPPDRQQPLDAYLQEFGRWLRELTRSTPGLADYMVHLFPRSPASGRLMEHAVAVAIGHGWSPPAALYITTTVARSTLSLVRAEVETEAYLRNLSAEAPDAVTRTEDTMRTLPLVSTAIPFFEGIDEEIRFEWYLRAIVAGTLVVAPDLEDHAP